MAVRNTTDNFTYVTVHAKVWRQRERGGEKLLRCVCVCGRCESRGGNRELFTVLTQKQTHDDHMEVKDTILSF